MFDMTKKNGVQVSKTEMVISLPKVFAGVLTSLIVGSIIGAFGVVRIVDSTSFKVIAIDEELGEIQAIVVPRVEYKLRNDEQDRRIATIEEHYESIDDKLDKLLELR